MGLVEPLVEPKESFWGSQHYLGRMLAPNEARESPLRGRFFHVADHVVEDLPEVQAYLSAQQ
jgi:hypothetical protein